MLVYEYLILYIYQFIYINLYLVFLYISIFYIFNLVQDILMIQNSDSQYTDTDNQHNGLNKIQNAFDPSRMSLQKTIISSINPSQQVLHALGPFFNIFLPNKMQKKKEEFNQQETFKNDRDFQIIQKYGRQNSKNRQMIRNIIFGQLEIDDKISQEQKQILYLLIKYIKYPLQQIAQLHSKTNFLSQYDLTNKFHQLIKYQQQQKQNYDQFISLQKLQRIQQLKKQAQIFCQKMQTNVTTCPCCNQIVQGQGIPLFTPITDVNNTGISIQIFFMHVKFIPFLVTVILIFIAVPSAIFNIIGAEKLQQYVDNNSIIDSPLMFKDLAILTIQPFVIIKGTKNPDQKIEAQFNKFIIIQLSIGVIVGIFWHTFFVFLELNQILLEGILDYNSISPSDYTLILQDMPRQIYIKFKNKKQKPSQNYRKKLQKCLNKIRIQTKKQLQQKLKVKGRLLQYQQILLNCANDQIKIFRLIFNANSHIPADQFFNDSKITKLNNQLDNLKQQFIDILQRLKNGQTETLQEKKRRKELLYRYHYYNKKLNENYQQSYELLAFEKTEENKHKNITNVYVIFQKTANKQFVQRLNKFDFTYRKKNQDQIIKHSHQIRRAPEPEDIIWSSVFETKQRVKYKIIMAGITLAIIAVQCLIKFFLQRKNQEISLQIPHIEPKLENISKISLTFNFFSLQYIIFAGFLKIANIIVIGTFFFYLEIFKYLTLKQQPMDQHSYQTSIGIKITIVLVANIIVVPLLTNVFLKEYSFFPTVTLPHLSQYAISYTLQIIFFAFLRFLNLQVYFFDIVTKKLKYLKKMLPKWYNQPKLLCKWRKKNWKKLTISQRELNRQYERPQFVIGSEYAKISSQFLFVCFFAYLQPLIVFIYLLYFPICYMSYKYALFNQCRKPTPGLASINSYMSSFFQFGPLFFTLGWNYFTHINGFKDKSKTIVVLNCLLLFVSIFGPIINRFIYFFTRNTRNYVQIRKSTYQKDRTFFRTEYEHTYPLTSKIALLESNKLEDKILNNKKDIVGRLKIAMKNKGRSSAMEETIKRLERSLMNKNKIYQTGKNFIAQREIQNQVEMEKRKNQIRRQNSNLDQDQDQNILDSIAKRAIFD